jgi:hypothetical protein
MRRSLVRIQPGRKPCSSVGRATKNFGFACSLAQNFGFAVALIARSSLGEKSVQSLVPRSKFGLA